MSQRYELRDGAIYDTLEERWIAIQDAVETLNIFHEALQHSVPMLQDPEDPILMRQREYLESGEVRGGPFCPKCRSDDVLWEASEHWGTHHEQEAQCAACDFRWSEVSVPIGFRAKEANGGKRDA